VVAATLAASGMARRTGVFVAYFESASGPFRPYAECTGQFYGSSESDAQMKRPLDVLACAVFLAVFWPVLLLIIVAIRLQSPGEAIFAQARVGKNGRPFTCYKLRTMYSGTANLPTHQVEASAVTPLGERLRRFKI